MMHLKIRKTVFAMLSACLLSSSALADNGLKIKVFCSHDNSSKEFNVDDISKISFGSDGMTFMFDQGKMPEEFFGYGDVGKMMFSGAASGIDNVVSEKKGNVEISYDGTSIKISGCDNAAQLRVFDVAGRPVMSEKFTGETVVNTENMISGVYILKVNGKTFKFSK